MKERKVLTTWPTELPEGRWDYVFNGKYADWRGAFVMEDGVIMYVLEDGGTRWTQDDFGPEEHFEPIPDDAMPVEDIDDKIDDWHEGKTGVSLPEHLGMTHEEYAAFVVAPPPLASPAVDAVVIPRMEEILSEVAALLGVPPEGVPDAVRRLLEPVETLERMRRKWEGNAYKICFGDDLRDDVAEWAEAGYPGTKGGRRGNEQG